MPAQDIPVVGSIINRLFGTANERVVKKYVHRVQQIGALEPEIRALSDAELRERTEDFRERMRQGSKPGDLLVEAFAVAREAMDRNVGIRNIFNPEHREAFPKDRLSDEHRRLYEQTLASMDAAEPRDPVDELNGHTEPVHGWQYMDIPRELYDAVRELFPESKPPFRSRPFDVQLIGGMVLYSGAIAEMKTGEGKTIVAPLASYLAAVEGNKVHVVTVNDYLVQRDRDWTFPFFRALGLTVGAIHPMHSQPEDVKRRMYQCDVVYGTTSEFGFDFLRDNMKKSAEQQVQRYREFAIVDEVDSTLIDEARTPLIISGQAHEDQPRYDLADQLARHLVQMQKPWADADKTVEDCRLLIKGTEGDIRNLRDKEKLPELQKKLEDARQRLPELEAERDRHTQYYEVERDKKKANLTHHGIAEVQKKSGLGSIYVGENTDLPHLIEQSVRAHVIYERDADYVVMPIQDPQTGRQEPDVVIVDQNTGRAMIGRQWSDGLHQAVQAKENVRVRPETQTVASITIQNFFKMYKRLAGMTGTADTEAQEFYDIYGLDVVTIPTNLPVIRDDFDDLVYLVEKDKWAAVADEIKAFHDMGRPVLVGTTSVEKSELISKILTQKHGIKHEVLNAKQHEREADIVLHAGRLGAVMIATNMAGRGTDIKLQRISRDELLDFWLKRGIAPKSVTTDDTDEQLREKIFRKVAVKELGLPKREAESMDFNQLERELLAHWAVKFAMADPKRAQGADADTLRAWLDDSGRFGLHRIGWVETVEQLGGLHVIGTERHESRRIDNQLRGRSGRQGDRGSSRFYVSLEDDLMKMFAGNTTMKLLSRMGMKEGDAIEHSLLSKSIARAQRKVEERNFQIRKNILEYDEVMEHQRQEFYGLRQRVLDGIELRNLVFEFIEDATREAVEKYLDKDYFAERAAEFAAERLGVSIPPERLRRKADVEEVEHTVRKIAREEASHEIDVTIGEYVPGEAELVDVDVTGLSNWAESRFGVELTSSDINEALERGSIKSITDGLYDAAASRIEETDLTGIGEYFEPNYGAKQLAAWLQKTLMVELTVQEITEPETSEQVVDAALDKVRDLYDKREIRYPVEFQLELVAQLMRHSPQDAATRLVDWANQRYGLGWDDSIIRTKSPQQVQQELQEASKKFVESGKLDQAIDEALQHDTAETLEPFVREKYGRSLPFWMARLRGDEFREQTKALIEGILRAELVQFERFVMLEVLDPAWKQHLYNMDQLRDTIGFRAFSQQDPRIEYKREGARIFREMMDSLHERVAEYVFRMRLTPQVAPPRQRAGQGQTPPMQRQQPPQPDAPQQQPQGQPAAPPEPSPAARVAGASGGISGPGFNA